MLDRILGNLDRVTYAIAWLRSKNLNTNSLTNNLKLVYCVRALQVGGYEKGCVPLILQPLRKLPGEGGLSRTLQTRKHDHGRWFLGKIELVLLAAEDGHELFVYDLNNLLSRVQRL